MTEVEQIQTNGIDTADDENKARPADIEAVYRNSSVLDNGTSLKHNFLSLLIQ